MRIGCSGVCVKLLWAAAVGCDAALNRIKHCRHCPMMSASYVRLGTCDKALSKQAKAWWHMDFPAKKRHCQLFVQSFCFVFANCHMTMVCISLYTAITGCGTALLCRGCSEYLVRTEYLQLRTSRKGSTKPRRVAYLQRHVHVSAPMHAEHAKSKLA